MDQSVVDPATAGQIGAGGAGFMGLLYWIFGRLHKRVDAVELKQAEQDAALAKTQLEIERHKTDSERAYAKAPSIDRLHERLDDMFKILIDIKNGGGK